MSNVLPEQVLRDYLAQMETDDEASMAALRGACDNLSRLIPSSSEAELARGLVLALLERALEDLTRAVPWNEELDKVRDQVRSLGREVLETFVKLHDPEANHMALLLQLNEGTKWYDSLVEELNDKDRQLLRNQSRSES